MATTAFCNSAKKELLQGYHCFNATTSAVTANTHTNTTLDNISSMTGVGVGMTVSGTNIAAGSVVANVTSTTACLLSLATTGTGTAVSVTFTGDVFKMALVKVGATGTYDGTVTNYGAGSGAPTLANLGTDETSGTGYTAGGTTLTNVIPSLSSTVGITQFSPNPNWTTATFSAIAAEIYNTSLRAEGVANRTISIHDFGGTQTVSAGTFTVVMPTFSSTLALLRIA
ncbi:MAG: hypothetical protein ACXV2C_00260 [Candidatus Bathyarchaeia archaeon]